MKQTKNYFIIGCIVIIGTCLFILASRVIDPRIQIKSQSRKYRKPILVELEGESLPSISILLPDSSTLIDVSTTSPDKATVLFYFGPDCPNCQTEIKEITGKITKMKNIQFYLLTPYQFPEMKEFYDQFQLKKYPNIITGYDYKFSFAEHFKIQSVPCIAIYGKDKRLKGTFIGTITHEQIIDLARK